MAIKVNGVDVQTAKEKIVDFIFVLVGKVTTYFWNVQIFFYILIFFE